jgi:hypothetical protein
LQLVLDITNPAFLRANARNGSLMRASGQETLNSVLVYEIGAEAGPPSRSPPAAGAGPVPVVDGAALARSAA